jgi:hypothetical protein
VLYAIGAGGATVATYDVTGYERAYLYRTIGGTP